MGMLGALSRQVAAMRIVTGLAYKHDDVPAQFTGKGRA